MGCGCNSDDSPHDGWGLIPELRLAGMDRPAPTSSPRAPAPNKLPGWVWAALLVGLVLFLRGRG